MKRRRLRAYFQILLWLALAPVITAAPQITYLKDVTISLEYPERAESPHGYFEVALQIANERNREVQLSVFYLGGYANHWGDSPYSVRQDLVLGPLETRRAHHLLPAWLPMPHQARFMVDGEMRDDLVSISRSRSFTHFESFLPVWVTAFVMKTDATGANLSDKALEQIGGLGEMRSDLRKHIKHASNANYLHHSESDPHLFSDNWVAYTAWDMVVVNEKQWAALRPAQKRALDQYMRLGGCLIMLEETQDDAWPSDFPIALNPSNLLNTRRIDFGLVAAAPLSITNNPDAKTQWMAVLDFAISRAHFWGSQEIRPLERNQSFPVISNLSVPHRTFIGLLIIMVLCIGPLNLWFLIKIDRRVWLFFTVPILSAAATLILVVAALVSEGITPTKRSEAFVVLDHQRDEVMTWATSAVYLPIANRNGLRFSGRNEVYFGDDSYLTKKGIDLNAGFWLQRGWLSTRIPFHYQERGRYPLGERLAVRFDEDGVPTVTNGFGADLSDLLVCNPAGQIFGTRRLAAGAEQVLEPDPGNTQVWTQGDLDPFSKADNVLWTATAERWLRFFEPDHKTQLGPNQYLAFLEGGAYLEDPLPGSLIRNERCLLFGRLGDKP